MIIQKLKGREKVQPHKIANKINEVIEELNKQEKEAQERIEILAKEREFEKGFEV